MTRISFKLAKPRSYLNFSAALISLILLASTLISVDSLAYYTYPASKMTTKSDPLKIDLTGEIPPDHENYTWKLHLPDYARKGGQQGIPVFDNPTFGRPYLVGTIPEGSEIKITRFDIFGFTHIYKIPTPQGYQSDMKSAKNLKHVWVSGRYIKATAYSPEK